MGKKEKKLKVAELADNLEVGRIYRLSELRELSKAVNRHVQDLVQRGILKRMSTGVYFYIGKNVPSKAEPDEEKLIAAFLRDDRFLLITPNTYKDVGLPPLGIHRPNTVYNHKRHGKFKLGDVAYHFLVKPYFPLEATKEFLLVDTLNNLVGDKEWHMEYVKKHVRKVKGNRLVEAIRLYAGPTARNFFTDLLGA